MRSATGQLPQKFTIGERVRTPAGELAIVVQPARELAGRMRVELRYLRRGAGEVVLPVELVRPAR